MSSSDSDCPNMGVAPAATPGTTISSASSRKRLTSALLPPPVITALDRVSRPPEPRRHRSVDPPRPIIPHLPALATAPPYLERRAVEHGHPPSAAGALPVDADAPTLPGNSEHGHRLLRLEEPRPVALKPGDLLDGRFPSEYLVRAQPVAAPCEGPYALPVPACLRPALARPAPARRDGPHPGRGARPQPARVAPQSFPPPAGPGPSDRP